MSDPAFLMNFIGWTGLLLGAALKWREPISHLVAIVMRQNTSEIAQEPVPVTEDSFSRVEDVLNLTYLQREEAILV